MEPEVLYNLMNIPQCQTAVYGAKHGDIMFYYISMNKVNPPFTIGVNIEAVLEKKLGKNYSGIEE